jgi:transcriptional regulator with XRE-family HTH domain
MPADKQARIAARAAALRAELALAEVRQALRLSQEEIGQTLQVGQAAVAKMEKRADMYVSTLRRFIRAMGGELDIVARFPDGEVHITNFRELSEAEG